MTEIIQNLQDFWGLMVALGAGISAVIGFFYKQKKNKKDSTEMLYQELENLKQKLIIQVPREIENATTIARQKFLLDQLQQQCPSCYEKVKNLTDVSTEN